jgi:O-antigen polymerase
MGIPLLAISIWGFGQLIWGITVYRAATAHASLRMTALAATALAARVVLTASPARDSFLRCLAWFASLIAITGVLAYFTSPGQILWTFASPYPDVWGPFLSRNNFAQFLELAFPVSWWLAAGRGQPIRMWMPALLLGAGLASASRAGALLLLAETAVLMVLHRPIRSKTLLGVFALLALAMGAVAGGGTLLGRLADRDPLRYRREIFQSTAAMIADRPWQGFGLGTFRTVYPQYASFDSGAIVEHAHNDWLEWASEGGVPFAAAWIALAACVCGPAIRSVWGLGVVAVFLHALVDYPFARFGISAWVFILIGALENPVGRFALTHRRMP